MPNFSYVCVDDNGIERRGMAAVVKTVNPGAGTVVAQDRIVVRPSSTTPAELWF
jgi:hypothetical protein